ncbi:hypothetical protein RUND412_002675 [Rhizina undulata]
MSEELTNSSSITRTQSKGLHRRVFRQLYTYQPVAMIPAAPLARILQPKSPAQVQQQCKTPASTAAKPARKRPRLDSPAARNRDALDEAAKAAELARERMASENKLKSAWESIFERYSKDFDGIADEIDPATGMIVVDNGHLRGMKDESDDENGEGFGWGEIVGVKKRKKRKRGDVKENVERTGIKIIKNLIVKEKGEDWDSIAQSENPGGCEICRERDELDDFECSNCATKENQTNRDPPLAAITQDEINSPATTSPSKRSNSINIFSKFDEDLPASPKGNTLSVVALEAPENSKNTRRRESEIGVQTPKEKDIPPDALILEKLASPGTAVVKTFAKARDQISDAATTVSKVPAPALPSEPSNHAPPSIPKEKMSKKSASTPSKFPKTPFPVPIPSQLPRSLHPPSSSISSSPPHPRKVLANSKEHPLPLITAEHSKPELPLPLSKLKLHSSAHKINATPSAQTKPKSIPSSTPIKASSNYLNPWAPPDPTSDPFYNPIWSDHHPDGTPEIFKLPRTPFSFTLPLKEEESIIRRVTRASAKKSASTPAKAFATPKPKKGSGVKGRGGVAVLTPGWTFTTTEKRKGKSFLSLLDDENSGIDDHEKQQEKSRNDNLELHSPILRRSVLKESKKISADKVIPGTPPSELDLPPTYSYLSASGSEGGAPEIKEESVENEEPAVSVKVGEEKVPLKPEGSKCRAKGFKCNKMFCFKCMGFEGEEDDLK